MRGNGSSPISAKRILNCPLSSPPMTFTQNSLLSMRLKETACPLSLRQSPQTTRFSLSGSRNSRLWEGKDKEVHGKILVSVPVVMLDVITLVFQGVKGFVFDLPAGAAGFHQHNDIVPVNGDVRNPAIMIGYLFPVHDPILKKIDLPGILCAIQRNVVHPVILVAFPFLID